MKLRYAFLFPGQGSQAVGMGKSFYENSDIARDMIDRASKRSGIEFDKLLFEDNDDLQKTEFTQPAILLISSIAERLFKNELNIVPSFSLGHSLGEFSALVSVGALDLMDAIELVNLRGKLMSDACEGLDVGMLACLGLADSEVENICEEKRNEGLKVWPVNYNSDGQIIIAGIKSDLEDIVNDLKESGAKRTLFLNMSVVSHCPLLESATEPFKQKLNDSLIDFFLAPVISNANAKKYSSKSEASKLLTEQLVSPVLYKQSIVNFDNEIDCYIEFGHGGVLKGLNKKLTNKPHFVISDIESLQNTIDEVLKLEENYGKK